jgi:hypothetical protein
MNRQLSNLFEIPEIYAFLSGNFADPSDPTPPSPQIHVLPPIHQPHSQQTFISPNFNNRTRVTWFSGLTSEGGHRGVEGRYAGAAQALLAPCESAPRELRVSLYL